MKNKIVKLMPIKRTFTLKNSLVLVFIGGYPHLWRMAQKVRPSLQLEIMW
jgi:hypothetical protein